MTSPEPAPQVLTEADNERTLTLATNQEVSLQLASSWFWDEPVVDGNAVTLTPVNYLVDPGFQEWLVTGTQNGDSVVTASGQPNCDDETKCPPRTVRIEFQVRS